MEKKIIKRKVIHFFIGLFLYMLYYIAGNVEIYSTFLFFFGFGIMLEYSFGMHKRIKLLHQIFETLRKRNEFLGEGLLFMIASFLIGSVVLNEAQFFALFWLVSISDSVATLAGKKYGKHKIFGNKSIEGFVGFIVSATPLLFILNEPNIVIYILISGLVELIDRLEDNISISTTLTIISRMGI